MRGKSWLFEGKVLGCAVVTVALIPKREFEKTDEEEKNKFIRDTVEDLTPLFLSRIQHIEDHVLYLNTKENWDNQK